MKEKELYVLVSHLDEDNIHGAKLSFHDISDPHCEAEKYRCYHSGGFSFEITRERSVDESEAGLLGTDKNGDWYNYTDLSEDGTGYLECGIDNAIKLVRQDGVFV